MPTTTTLLRLACVTSLGLGLAGCTQPHRAVQDLPSDPAMQTRELAELKDALDQTTPAFMARAKKAEEIVPLTGMGFSQVSGQPGKTTNEKRLMAIRAARLEAMRDLTEQVHGIRLDSSSTVNDQVLRSDYIRGLVDGEIRGARTTSIKPKSADTFEVILTLDPDVIRYIIKAAKTGR
ncbi:hypothetical protein HJ526_02920 [Donghicola sp. C2-DW-16]|uniref:Lipoprotein LPP20-like domain-containing protein n=1 Tax=Donghicola mangrovi TaxID=2729614 RepID=A0A850Q4R0_9RHOB|nr:LPP20 family lipoprotein [Donghicola mangrovi]NVO22048.1 hypothetical protein [Donghicola mangrovi]NVO26361.1 hypothetical protein [Donghicola mangrovi]